MAVCNTCYRKRLTLAQKKAQQALEKKAKFACTLNLLEVNSILDRLYCLKSRYPHQPKVNNYIGQIEEMISIGDYCKYNYEPYFEALFGTNC